MICVCFVFEVALGNGFTRFLQFSQIDGGPDDKRYQHKLFNDQNDRSRLRFIEKNRYSRKFGNCYQKHTDAGFWDERDRRAKASEGTEETADQSADPVYDRVFYQRSLFDPSGKAH